MKRLLIPAGLFSVCVIVIMMCTSFSPRKPHRIVGLWSSLNEAKITCPAGKHLTIDQWYFSSDGVISQWNFKSNKKKELRFKMVYRLMDASEAAETYDDLKPLAQSKQELLLLKSTCHDDFYATFSIHTLTKDTLKVRFEPSVSSPQVKASNDIMTFERIAGPPENM